MTQRIQFSAPLRASIHVFGRPPRATTLKAERARRNAWDRACRWGFMAICLIAVAAAGVIARGGIANAELRLAAAAVTAAPVVGQDICSADGAQRFSTAERACANPHGDHALASAEC
jgi:hypothetical protein